jgi:hypothetical protein
MRKYLDILVEQPNLPNQEFVNALDSAHSSGQINKSYYDTLGSNEQAMLLRNVDNFKRTNPNYNSNYIIEKNNKLKEIVDKKNTFKTFKNFNEFKNYFEPQLFSYKPMIQRIIRL